MSTVLPEPGILTSIWDEHAGESGVAGMVRGGLEKAAQRLSSGEPLLWEIREIGGRTFLVRGTERIPYLKVLPHQQVPYLDDGDRKLLRQGRRAGKTRLAFLSAVEGHGPLGKWSQGDGDFQVEWAGRKLRGILSGLDVVWLARDHKQAGALWNEEIKPKFKGRRGVYVNENDHSVTLEDAGTLWVRSNENVDSIRGIGDRLVGVIIDEAAHLNLKYAIQEVIVPALSDNEGWLIAMSTTNAGRDGDPEFPSGPSYFNRLCMAVASGERSDYHAFHATARDNPRITAAAFQKLVAEYDDPAGHAYQQEVEAALLKGLHGLMFSRWREDVHVRRFDRSMLEEWQWEAGLDWGYSSPGWFGLGAFGPKGREHLFAEYSFNGKPITSDNLTPFEVGKVIGRLLQELPKPRRIVADSSMWDVADGRGGKRAISDAEALRNGIAEILGPEAPPLVKSAKGKGSRHARVKHFAQSLRFTEVETTNEAGETVLVVPSWGEPRFTSDPRNKTFNTATPGLPVDPSDADDIDTTANDHPFDGWTYLTALRPQHSKEREAPKKAHAHPGLQSLIEQAAGLPAPEEAGPRYQRGS